MRPAPATCGTRSQSGAAPDGLCAQSASHLVALDEGPAIEYELAWPDRAYRCAVRYLLDTNVASALRVRGREPRVQAWAASIPVAAQHISAMTVAEIALGVVAKERSEPAQRAILRRWLEEHVPPSLRRSTTGAAADRLNP